MSALDVAMDDQGPMSIGGLRHLQRGMRPDQRAQPFGDDILVGWIRRSGKACRAGSGGENLEHPQDAAESCKSGDQHGLSHAELRKQGLRIGKLADDACIGESMEGGFEGC